MMDMIDYIVSADLAEDAQAEQTITKSRSQINTLYDRGTVASEDPKMKPPKYIEPTADGYPGLEPPLG